MTVDNILDSLLEAGRVEEYDALVDLLMLIEPTTFALWEADMREKFPRDYVA